MASDGNNTSEVIRSLVSNIILSIESSNDHNGAFDGGESALYGQFERLGYKVKKKHVSTVNELNSALKNENDGTVAHLIIRSHGNQDYIGLSGIDILLKGTDDFNKSAKLINEKLSYKSSVFLHGCKYGEGRDSFAQMLADKIEGHEVIASTSNIGRFDVEIDKIKIDDFGIPTILYNMKNNSLTHFSKK